MLESVTTKPLDERIGPSSVLAVDREHDFPRTRRIRPSSISCALRAFPIAERIRKIGGQTLRSIGHIARTQRVLDNDAIYVEPSDMLAELREDNKWLAARLREAHGVCDQYRDIATASLIEGWIDEAERRTWFLRPRMT